MSSADKYLIVGQGLAGSVLAYQLRNHHIEFDIIDNNHEKSGSMAAGGIMHPMSFKRLILAWKALEMIDAATSFYEDIQQDFNTPVFQKSTFYRPFLSIEEQNNWMAKMNEPPFNVVLGVEDLEINGVNTPYGVGTINYSGRLEVQDFLKITREFFQDCMCSEPFDFNALVKEDEHWKYKNKIYKGVIFCEGYQFIYNPYFNYLPRNLTKGEIIEISTTALDQKMISRGCFIVPQKGKDNYLVGSTYAWNTVSEEITPKAKVELIEKVEKVIHCPYEVYNQLSGIRPTISDRRPLIGEHPTHSGLFIFNGMGSKTVMMAPLLSNQFISLLKGTDELFPEANISRHTKKHFHKFEAYEADKMSKL